MMVENSQSNHPSPHRHKVSWLRLVIGLFGAPTAWAAQIIFSQMLASYACYPHHHPINAPLWNWLEPALVIISLCCFLFGSFSAYTAWVGWQKSKHERGGKSSEAIQTGEGRTRFLTLIGAMVSLLFMITMFFTASAILLVHPCR